MAPADLAGLIVDGLDHGLAPNAVIRARPPVKTIGRLGKVDAVAGLGIDDKQPVLGVETGGTVVGQTTLVRCNQASIGSRLLGGIWNRTALFIDSKRPVYRPERCGQEIPSVRSV